MSAVPVVHVVHADPVFCDTLGALLRSSELDFELYASTAQFLERADPARPGCLVLDIDRLGMSLPDLQRRLVEREVPIADVFLTARAHSRLVARAIDASDLDPKSLPMTPETPVGLVERVRRALSERARPEAGPALDEVPAPFARLTSREREVAKLVVEGASSKQIAKLLRISKNTVDNHRSHIFSKLGVGSAMQLAALYFKASRRGDGPARDN